MAPLLIPFMDLHLAIEADDALPGRRLVRYWGGSFSVPREGPVRGTVIGGADHGFSRTDARRHIHARIVLEADDGTPLTLTMGGIGPPDGPWTASGFFEAPEGKHGWLNAVWVVGNGLSTPVDGTPGERWSLYTMTPRQRA